MGKFLRWHYALPTVVALGISSALAPERTTTSMENHKTTTSLSAMPQSSAPWGARGMPSNTARESAFNVEFEPMTELERRIEDGLNYEHIPLDKSKYDSVGNVRTEKHQTESIPSARGVFAGYRFTQEEYDRLKSADPSQ